ncbi:MAG: LacI family DNA-binding transcriptional regulator [Eubacteriales bacterium]|nr:LacI family DNA-binding transcriptional regulator [Eubacteriales bacterium]
MRKSTISQVAKRAGVSVATVSRVINQTSSVTRETAQRVLSAIEELGYQPNVWGQNLRRGESRVILVLVPNVSNPFYAPIISGAEDALGRAGYSMMLGVTNVDAERRNGFLDFMGSGRADGAILMDTVVDDHQLPAYAREFPMVQCCEYDFHESLSHISIDNFSAAREAVLRLMELGHRNIGFVGADNRFVSTKRRLEGFRAALAEGGLPIRPENEAYASGDYSFSTGVTAAGRLLDQHDRPTALFCISDVLALGALQAARDRKIPVPQALSVVGFDDVQYAAMFQPQLTTVRQPCYRLGYEAAELLLRKIRGESGEQACFLRHQLIERDSTAKCR